MLRNLRLSGSALLLLLALVFYLPGLLSPRDFTVADEARYAEVLREMTQGGHWLVPQLNGQYYADKPPIYFWLAAAVCRALGGITPFGFMIITWIGAAGSVLLAYRLGAEIYDRRSALLCALLLMSTFVFLACAQIVRMDMPMTLCITAAMYCFWRGCQRQRPAYFYGFYAWAALAVLIKGPLGFLLAFVPAAGFLIQKRQWIFLRRFVLHWGLLLFAVLVSSWLVLAWFAGEREFVKDIFVRQIAGRAIRSSVQRQPFYFYALVLPFVLLPWSGFLYRALRDSWRTKSDGVRLLLWWAAADLVVLSAISGKLFIYLLPLTPPLLLMVGAFFARLTQSDDLVKRGFRAEAVAPVVLTFLPVSLLPFVARRVPALEGIQLWPLTAIFLPLTILGTMLGIKRRPRAFLVTMTASMWIFSAYAFQVLMPQVNDLASARLIGQDIARRLRQGESVATFRVQRGILNFYAETEMPELTAPELTEYLRQPRRAVVMSEKEFHRQQTALGNVGAVLAGYYVVDRRYVLVGKEAEQP